jgi:hypothetical protein
MNSYIHMRDWQTSLTSRWLTSSNVAVFFRVIIDLPLNFLVLIYNFSVFSALVRVKAVFNFKRVSLTEHFLLCMSNCRSHYRSTSLLKNNDICTFRHDSVEVHGKQPLLLSVLFVCKLSTMLLVFLCICFCFHCFLKMLMTIWLILSCFLATLVCTYARLQVIQDDRIVRRIMTAKM